MYIIVDLAVIVNLCVNSKIYINFDSKVSSDGSFDFFMHIITKPLSINKHIYILYLYVKVAKF